MAHYAKINQYNIVEQVIVIDNSLEPTEADGTAYCQSLFNGGNWKKTSYNDNIRKNFAGIGYTYDVRRDAFIAPRPYASWILDEATCQWTSPVPYPQDDKVYGWDDINQEWFEIEIQ